VTARGPDRPVLVDGLPNVDEVTLGGLEVADAVALAAAVVDEPVDAAAIAREAQGHPMFIAELSRFAAERRATAGSLDDALWSRACDLTQAAKRLLHVVVTDGAALPWPIAVTASQLDPDEAADAIAELRAALPLLETYNMIGPAAAVRWQLGRLVGGDEGAALIERSRAWLCEIGAVSPERMIGVGMPGIGD
jgi:hypothetical protein